MKNHIPSQIVPDSPGFAWLARALGPRDGVLRLSDELWTAVEPLLALHRATGLLYDRILEGTVEAPRLVRYELSARLARWTEATREWPELAGKVLDELRRRDVPHLVLKGWALIPLLYGGRRELREACDLDVLIPREHLAEADAVLLDEGFAIPPQAELRPGFAHKYNPAAQYIRWCGRRWPLWIDLHWQAISSPHLWPMVGHDWFARVQKVLFDGRRMNVPATEDLFLHLCGHEVVGQADDPTPPLYRLVDLLRVAGLPGFSWPTVLERARNTSLTGSLRSRIEAVHTLWPGAIPKETVEICCRLPVSPAEAKARRDILARTIPLRLYLSLRWIPGWRARVEYVRGKLFPSAAHLRAMHHLPANASYVRGLLARYGHHLTALRRD